MSSGQDCGDVGNDKKNNTRSPTQERILLDSIEGGINIHNNQYPSQSHRYPQHPQIPAHLHQPELDKQTSPYNNPPPNYNYDDPKLRYGPSASQGNQAIGRQPAHTATRANYPQAAAVTYHPPATGQCVVTQPHGVSGHRPAMIVQPNFEPIPKDHMGYSVCVTLSCCWIIGLFAICKSTACLRALAVGDRELAKKKSASALHTANASLAIGILMYVILGVIAGLRVMAVRKYYNDM